MIRLENAELLQEGLQYTFSEINTFSNFIISLAFKKFVNRLVSYALKNKLAKF